MQRLSRERLVWAFAADARPAYSVEPGETFLVETLDALGGIVQPGMAKCPHIERANPATGPIAVRGARPGQLLAVDILRVEPVGLGYLTYGGVPRFYEPQGGLIAFTPDIRLPLAPVIGTIGVMPGEGSWDNRYPGDYGGNLDTRDVAAGATLYLLVRVEGALLALGDVHATQGDGESSGQGIETGAEVTLRVRLLEEALSPRPYLLRAGELMTIASGQTLDEACRLALEDLAQIIVAHSGLDYSQVRMLLGQSGDLRIGQIVNPLKTARMTVPLGLVPWTRPLPL